MSKEHHHHGNLRTALVNAGVTLMEQGGPDALTLRKCAALAGVSHAAPAHHFNGLISLKAAIVAHSYQLFTGTMQAHSANATTPRARLVAICAGYLAFARQHPALFRFMFQAFPAGASAINPPILQELATNSAAAYKVLQDACAPFQPVGGQVEGAEVLVWSLVHGYAMLFASTQAPGTPTGTPTGLVPDFADILPEFPLC